MKLRLRSPKFLKAGVVLVAASVCGIELPAQVSFGKADKFNDGWRFVLSDDSLYKAPGFDDSGWRELSVPHDWSVEGQLSPSLASCTGYLPGGIGWYRKRFEIKDTLAKHFIYFEGVYNRSEVYLNGQKLGVRPNGYVSFMYDMTPYLRAGENELAVRVDHSRSADSRWYTGSGIYRDVYLVSAPATHISQWGVGFELKKLSGTSGLRPQHSVEGGMAEAQVSVEVENPQRGVSLYARLYDAAGKMVASGKLKSVAAKNKLNLKIKNPKLWSVESPTLYSLRVELKQDGECIDSTEIPVGIRTIEFSADKGFFLNGKSMKIKGVCLHHDAGVLGAAVPEDVWRRKLIGLKELGVNAIRTSHNPQAPVFYDLCDRLGLLVMDEVSDEWEFPKRKWLEGWNVGTPGFQGSYDFFEEWIDRDVTDMVRRDRNHASVILWSIGNEVDYPNDPYSHPVLNGSDITQPMYGGYNPEAPDAKRIGKIAKRLAACVRAVDRSRPVTGALAGVVMSNETEYPEAVDVVGYNYTENRYDEDHAGYPERVIYGSENRQDYQAWKAVADREFISGQFLWTGTDYLGESRRWPSRGFGTGLLDLAGFVKPRGYFRASLWSGKPMTYIGTYPGKWGYSIDAPDIWNYDDGEQIRVVCYTNSPQARLLLNGREVGALQERDEKTGMMAWDIPYEAGELRAEGCNASGEVESQYAIATTGRPYLLRVESDVAELKGDESVAHLVVEILDEDGRLVKLGDNEIRCDIEGPGVLLGLEGGNNADMSDYTDNRHRAFGGRLLAYIKRTPAAAGGENGEGLKSKIKLKFSSPLLRGCEIEI